MATVVKEPAQGRCGEYPWSAYSAAMAVAVSGSRWRSLGATSYMNKVMERARFSRVAYSRPAWNMNVPKPPT